MSTQTYVMLLIASFIWGLYMRAILEKLGPSLVAACIGGLALWAIGEAISR